MRLLCTTLLAPFALGSFVLLADGCVGDTPASTSDASTVDANGSDVVADAPDVAPPADCDPKKPFGPPVLVPELSSSLDETGVRLSWDERTVYFNRPSSPGGKNQLWYATRSDRSAPFAAPTPLANVGAPTANLLHPMVSKDDKTLFFASDEGDAAVATTNLFSATRPDGGSPAASPFSSGQRIAALGGVNVFAVTPYLSADGTELFYAEASDAGGLHLWRAVAPSFSSNALVAELDAPTATTRFPVLSADGLTIYFDSNRPGGAGGLDIWFATRASTSAAFGTPVNASTSSPALNSAGDDNPTWISPDGCRLWLTSTRDTLDAGTTNRDVYVATRPK